MKTISNIKLGDKIFSPWDGTGKVVAVKADAVTISFLLKTKDYTVLPDVFEVIRLKAV